MEKGVLREEEGPEYLVSSMPKVVLAKVGLAKSDPGESRSSISRL